MRITSQMTQATSLYYIGKNYSSAAALIEKTSAERQIINLQDNASGSITGMKILSIISKTEQYQTNIAAATGSIKVADGYLDSAKSMIDKIKSLVSGAANDGTANSETRQANASELVNMLQSLLQSANANDGERYIFGGTYTGSEPYTLVGGSYVLYNGNNNGITYQTGTNTTTSASCTGTDAFGNMTTTVSSTGNLNPGVNLGTDISTSLSALNGGAGVPSGKITVYYSSYPNGLDVYISNCTTLEDVKDCIENATLEASKALDPKTCSWLDDSNLNWHDLQDRYVEVTLNPDGNGISLREYDLGEPLPEPTTAEAKKGLAYVNYPNTDGLYAAGAYGAADDGSGDTLGKVTLHDKTDSIYSKAAKNYSSLKVDNCAGNTVATALGIKGTADYEGFLNGGDLNPIISKSTLLADLEGYNNAVYTITNGSLPNSVTVGETSADANNVFSNWALNNLSAGYNTGSNGELYARVTRRDPPEDDVYVELYTVPLDKAKASDLVATGSLPSGSDGGTVTFTEANNSGVSGTVGLVFPTTQTEATVDLTVDFGSNFSNTVSVPAFVEEVNDDGTAADYLGLLSGWNITGLDKPPASGHDLNHPASTDLNGDISVNLRMVTNNDGTTSVKLELYRPSYDDQPATLIATGELNVGALPLDSAASGRIAITGVEGFEQIGGSVYLELPSGTELTDGVLGAGADSPTTLAYQLADDLAANTEMYLGGATELVADQTLATDMKLKADTVFKAGQVFSNDIVLPSGVTLTAGTPLSSDTTLKKGATIGAGTDIQAGTVLPAGQTITFSDELAAGTVIPKGSYTTDGVTGFPADGMMSSDAAHAGEAIGFGLTATFATVEDLMRAVEEAGVYASMRINDAGTGLEFVSNLAGAYLTISEDVDCYEQINDVYQQLSALDLNGLVKGVNSDSANGNVYTETVFYPPAEGRTDGKAVLVSNDGTVTLIDAGYYVRVYSDAEALNTGYENRDNSTLVAEGFLPVEVDQNSADPLNPYLAGSGSTSPLVLEERNGSGVSGTVTLDYYNGKDQLAQDPVSGEYEYSPYNNANITVAPGGLRTVGSSHSVIQEIDIAGFTPGVHCDYSGVAHGTIHWDEASSTTTVSIYRDTSNSHMTAKGELNAATGEVTLYETDKQGNYTLDANGARIKVGSMVVSGNTIADGNTEKFSITTGALGASGQNRETNLFSTINDCISALNNNDVEALHNLLDTLALDAERLTAARADLGSVSDQLDLLSSRYGEDIVSYTSIYQSTIGMDATATAKAILDLKSAQTAYDAAIQVASSFLQNSLLSYL